MLKSLWNTINREPQWILHKNSISLATKWKAGA